MYNLSIMRKLKQLLLWVILFFLTGCGNLLQEQVSPTQSQDKILVSPQVEAKSGGSIFQLKNTLTVTKTAPFRLWINPMLTNQVIKYLSLPQGVEIVSDYKLADYQLDVIPDDSADEKFFTQYFIVSVPFTSFINDYSFEDLTTMWHSATDTDARIWVKEDDLFFLEEIFGHLKTSNVFVSDKEPAVCETEFVCYHINRFEEVSPLRRVIAINGVFILDRYADLENYPLKNRFAIQPITDAEKDASDTSMWWMQTSNFNADLLTVAALTGTTALSRGTAYQMEMNGVNFPAGEISKVLQRTDILHISHEVPIFDACPPAVPLRKEMRFCSAPENIALFTNLGVDVVELTGNHLLDWGPEAFLETLSYYRENGLRIYGAGQTPEQAKTFLELTDHGNQFVFIGCNVSGPDNIWVTSERPGVLKCDQDFLNEQIKIYRGRGFIPVVTYQHYELDGFTPNPQLQADFWESAAAGAAIVSGSQAHFPQGFDFVKDAFIDYGVGNLFFDQMQTWYRKATIDLHYFYEGRYINTELVSIINEHQGQPRLMTQEETERFLTKLFEHSFYYEKK